jgi:hypothetical protein
LAPGFAVTGLAAALLQGVAARVECLDILVLDRDDILLTLSDVMQRAMVIFSPKSPDELRRVVNRSWGFIGCDVTITLVPELPATVVRRRSVGRRSGRCRAWSRT